MSTPIPRYLVPFHPKHVPHFFTDVLIVGSGLAGLRAALGVDARLSVVVATKQAAEQSNSYQAQGGIAGVLDPNDRFEDHVADTLEAGGSLCEGGGGRAVFREVYRNASANSSSGARSSTRRGNRWRWGAKGGHGLRPRRPRLRRRDGEGDHPRDG